MQRILLYTISLCFLLNFSWAQKAPSVDDELALLGLRGAWMAPDGQRIIYGQRKLDWDKNKSETTYYQLNGQGEDAYQFIGKSGASDIQFSPDGKYISLKRKAKDSQQLFFMRSEGGEAIQATQHAVSVKEYVWSADSKKIYFVANQAPSAQGKKAKKAGNDHVVIDEGPNGQRLGSWEYFYVFDLEKKSIRQLTGGELLIGSWDIAPNQSQLIFTARKENRRNQGDLSEIYAFQIQDSTLKQLSDNQAPEGRVQFAPDGKSIIYTASGTDKWELVNTKLWHMELSTGKANLISGQFEGSMRGDIFWSTDSKKLYFTGLQKTITKVFELTIESGKVEAISDNQKGNYTLHGMSKDRNTLLLSYQDLQTPADLYLSERSNFKPKKVSDLNPNFKKDFKLASTKVTTWKSKDDLEIEGLLFLPPNYDKKKKYPFLLHIHGGPAGVFTENFSLRYHVWASLGYVQLCPNVRGSSGYTDALLQGNMGDIGNMDYEDLMSGVDKLIAQDIIDPEKMAVRGWSYGGILGGMTIGKTDRFKAASLGAMVSDWRSEYGIGFNYDVKLWYIGGTPWDNPEGYRDKSPLTYVENVKTPVILFHGANDRTDTEAQSMMFFAALKDLGKTVRYLQFPREPHGFREPRHIRTQRVEEIKWIQKYTLGIDWKPWERESPEKKADTSKSK